MISFDRQAILDCLSRLVTPGIKLTALADELGVRKQEYAQLRAMLLELVEDGTVHVLPGGAFALPPSGRPADPRAKLAPPPLPPPAPLATLARKSRDRAKPSKPRVEPAKRARLPWPARDAQSAPKPAAAASASEAYDPDAAIPALRDDDRANVGRITVHPAGY